MSKTNSLNQLLGATKTVGTNIGKSKALAGRGEETHFVYSQLGKSRLGVVETNNRLKIDQTGDIVGTGVDGDFAISGGTGMVVVQDSTGGRSFTNVTSFRINENGDLENDASKLLSAWKLDAEGNRPSDFSLTSSLSKVNLFGFNSKPTATTSVKVQMNLDSALTKLKGAGEVIRVSQNGLNAGIKEDEIIIPENIPSGGLQLGDQITLTSLPENQARIFEFGGIAISKKINDNLASPNGFYRARTTSATFSIVPNAPAIDQLVEGQGLTITIDGVPTQVVARNNPNAGLKEFSTLDTLRDVIKGISGITATIKDNRLLIAPLKGNVAVTFTDLNGVGLKDTLGLIDIPAAGPGISRFSSLKTLTTAINTNNDLTGLEATAVSGGVDIHSLLATSSFNITGSSNAVHNFRSAVYGTGTEQGRATMRIESPNHGLRVGDYVRIIGGLPTAGARPVPDGLYMVGQVNGDFFTISVLQANPAALPAAGAPISVNNGAFSWQKVNGESLPRRVGALTNAAGGGNVTVTLAIHGFIANDIVYISGVGNTVTLTGQNISVPDGYYIVQAANLAAGSFEIIPAATAGGAGNPAPGAPSIQKVGVSNGGAFVAAPNNFQNRVMTTNAGEAIPVPVDTIRLFIPNNNYNQNDFFRMTGLRGAGPLDIDNMRVRNDLLYQITATTTEWIEFKVPPADLLGARAGNVNSFNRTAGGPAATDTQDTFRVDNYSRTFNYLNLSQDKFQFNPTYENSSAKSITNKKHPLKSVFTHSFVLTDSLGDEHEMLLSFAKLDKHKWTVELAGLKAANGDFQLVVPAGREEDGVVATGTIEFNTDGSLASFGPLGAPLNIEWRNGSKATSFTFDWGTLGGAVAGGADARDGITQVRAPSAPGLGFKANGNTAGSLTGFSITPDGSVVLSFSNGEVLTPYQIAVATAPNINGLQPGDGGTYTETKASGKMVLGIAGQVGIPELIPRSIELSNIDTTKELLDVKDLGDAVQAVARVLNADHLNFKTILSETQN